MILLTPDLRFALRANAINRCAAVAATRPEQDPVPVVKLLNPLGAATRIATELHADGDTLLGLADLGFGCPELGVFSLSEIACACRWACASSAISVLRPAIRFRFGQKRRVSLDRFRPPSRF